MTENENIPDDKSITKLLRQGIKNEFTSHLKTLGFKRDKIDNKYGTDYGFRRVLPTRHDIVTVSFGRYYKPNFIICFGSVPVEGIVDSYDRAIPAEKVEYYMLVKYGCLRRNWLQQSFSVSKRKCKKHGYEIAVNEEINLAIIQFQKVEDWFSTGKASYDLGFRKNDRNAPGVTKRYMIEQGTWPPDGWKEDAKEN